MENKNEKKPFVENETLHLPDGCHVEDETLHLNAEKTANDEEK